MILSSTSEFSGWFDAARIFRNGDYYYLIYSEGSLTLNYGVCVARAKCLDGEWELRPSNPLLSHRSMGPFAKIQTVGDADMYFDRDGIVVESSKEKLKDVPEVTGLKFQSIVLYKKLPAENDAVFDRILTVTQLLSKYGLHADRIYFSTTSSMSLYFGDVRADLGEDQYTDEKISNLRKILPSLKNKKGTVDLVNYTPDTSYITFREKGS